MTATRGVVATPHHLASEVGAQVLRDGGNAIDAAIAADAVLCVVYPHMTSVGGDLMAIVWPAGADAPVGLVGAGRSGELATAAAVRERGHVSMPVRGAMTVTVPGTVEAWGRLLERFGTLGLSAVLEAAASIAQDGFVITAHVSDALKQADFLRQERPAHALYPPMDAGMLLRNPDLASVLKDIGRAGINPFYRGEIASAIASALGRRDGFVTARDLATHHSEWVEPVAFRYHGLTVFELPAPTQGLAAAAMLVRLEAAGADRLPPGAEYVERFKAVRDVAYGLRDRYITDPDFSPAPIQPFLDATAIPVERPAGLDGGDTVYLCAADDHGNLVSMIQSVAFDFGSGIVAEGTGILLQNRGCYFSLDPAHVNRLEPRKRTMHTLIPAMAAQDGTPWLAFGSMGGDAQPQFQAQVLGNLVARGFDPEEAVSAPRFRVSADGTGIAVEADASFVPEIRRVREDVELVPPRHGSLGHAHMIVVDGPGAWRAAADPRSDGSASYVR